MRYSAQLKRWPPRVPLELALKRVRALQHEAEEVAAHGYVLLKPRRHLFIADQNVPVRDRKKEHKSGIRNGHSLYRKGRVCESTFVVRVRVNPNPIGR